MKGDGGMPDLVDTMQQEIVARLNELAPLVVEFERLQAAVAALEEVPGATAPSPGTAPTTRKRAGAKRRPGRPRSSKPNAPVAKRAPRMRRKRKRAPGGAAQRGILAALEHGSHNVRELVRVTAMSDANVRGNLSRLVKDGAVSKTERGDGKSAYALPSQVVAA
jgi:DNA-binding transcriptional ArsR family regulator